MELFGYTIVPSAQQKKDQQALQSVTPEPNDGSVVIDVSGMPEMAGDAFGYSMSFDVDPSVLSEQQLIQKYREISQYPEVEMAIDDIINEMATTNQNEVVTIDLDELQYSVGLKKQINDEFKYILRLLSFNKKAHNVMKRWYVDGRLTYQVIVDPTKYAEVGISKLTYIDPRLIKKVKVVKKGKDQRTGVDVYADRDEFFLFSETGFGSNLNVPAVQAEQGVKMAKDAVVQITSGILNTDNTVVLSYLHKAIRPLNQLRSLEDSAIIYRLSRAPERRIFYIDVGNLPPAKAEQVVKRQMQQMRTKMVYDVNAGTMRSDPKQLLMTEDLFLPRRSDGKATEIQTLPGGQNLGEMTEVDYFLNKLYRALNVPISRMDPQAGFNLGRVMEINRDELKFMKFVDRLRLQFTELFTQLLRRQLALKNILNPEEFDNIVDKISFEFLTDSMFEEAKDNEIQSGRMELLEKVNSFKGVYFSQEWICREILRQSQEDMEEMQAQIEEERSSGVYDEDPTMAADEEEAGPGGGGMQSGGEATPMQFVMQPAPVDKPAPKKGGNPVKTVGTGTN